MKIAFISDIHGNLPALEAVLDDIENEKVDLTVCGGDIVNPLPTSVEVWNILKDLEIPTLRGNHEDYFAAYYKPELNPLVASSLQFLPTQVAANHFGKESTLEVSNLPFDLLVPGPGGDDIYFCHASPLHNAKSFFFGIPDEMAQSIRKVSSNTIVAGHIHEQYSREFEDKNLVIAGSVGIPHSRVPMAQYVIMEHHQKWTPRFKQIPFDHLNVVQTYQHTWCKMGGPIAWLLLAELMTHHKMVAPFLHKLRIEGFPEQLKEWELKAQTYLKSHSCWEKVQPFT